MTLNQPMLRRRDALLGLGSAIALGQTALAVGPAPRAAAATPARDRRLVVVILRGALDGLAAITPYGDASLAGLRAPLLLPEPGRPGGMLDLGGFYGLHPALGGLHALYRAGSFLPVHAVIGPTHSRSHFDAQDDLESGAPRRLQSGWLGRAVGFLPQDQSGAVGQSSAAGSALAVGSALPLLLRGPAEVSTWAPDALQTPPPELFARIAALNIHDPVLGRAIEAGLRTRALTDTVLGSAAHGRSSFATLSAAAGSLLAAANGPRIAALEIGGWDTHDAQTPRLAKTLEQLDQGLSALGTHLGPAWMQTAVLVMTEFGRTVRVNGTAGTDHGTASVAFLLGGAIKGGRVGGTWPGLSPAALFENRDLAPTTDLRSLAKGLLRDHLGLRADALAAVFPGSEAITPQHGLV